MAAALCPDPPIATSEIVRLARTSAESDGKNSSFVETLGAALYRDGQFQPALGQLTHAIELHGRGGTAWMQLFLAMAHH